MGLLYATSKKGPARLARPAVLRLSAPAALYEFVDGTWQSLRYTPATADEGSTSVVELIRPGTFLQAYDPASAPPATASDAVERADVAQLRT